MNQGLITSGKVILALFCGFILGSLVTCAAAFEDLNPKLSKKDKAQIKLWKNINEKNN